MLRITQNSSAGQAKSYYSTSDYYTEGQELAGIWRGAGATRLGLAGKVDRAQWDALCDNRDPATGKPLTVRRKGDRTIGYDFTFDVPKSVSLVYALTGDARIMDAFGESVRETMAEMEAEMKTRVRLDGANEDRTTGNMVWAEFTHLTSRPVDGVPDPHLHAHCFVHNVTFDEREQRWKAGQFRELKRDAPYFEGRFHVRMARKMQDLGLGVERGKKGWELAGFDKATLSKFSRRTTLIEEKARQKGITSAEEKSALGAKTRERKQKNLSMADLRELWRQRLSSDEGSAIANVTNRIGRGRVAEKVRGADDAMRLATDHCFERKSVIPEREFLAETLKRAVGEASLQTVDLRTQTHDLMIAERDGRRFATTREVLAEESRMLDFARRGRGACRPLGRGTHLFKRAHLNEGQRRAVRHALESTDRVILIRGTAGTGKTTMMQETVEAIEAAQTKVFTFAPSAAASRGVLAAEGFKDADTVARLLKDEKLQDQVRDAVIWVDEAGLLGVKTTAQLFDLAEKQNARLVLSGDRRQHGSVERGAALRLLETEAGLVPAEIRDIQRQKGAYKQAVQLLSEGRTEDGFAQLADLGWVKEAPEEERYKLLANEYVESVCAGKSALVISPTHAEGDRITQEIRDALKRRHRIGDPEERPIIGREERTFVSLQNAHLTLGERADVVNYAQGDVIEFHQNAKGFRKGDRLTADASVLPLDQAERFQTYRKGTISVAPGDLLRLTKNGRTKDGLHRLNNGAIFKVKDFTAGGDILLGNGWTLDKDFGHIAHGFCVTSHASQGSTVDRVIIGQSAESFPASSREQFYVSVSRGREKATVYTDDKMRLLEAVGQCDERLSATEFAQEQARRERGMMMERMQRTPELTPTARTDSREVFYER